MSDKTKIIEGEKPIHHPLEEVFEIEEGTTIVPHVARTTEMIVHEEYDKKDGELEEQFQEVYDAALGAFEGQMDEAELVEGKYKARNGEVAVQFLNAALAAAREKAGLKKHKDKVAIEKGKIGTPKTQNNNLIIADRNELLKQFMDIEDE